MISDDLPLKSPVVEYIVKCGQETEEIQSTVYRTEQAFENIGRDLHGPNFKANFDRETIVDLILTQAHFVEWDQSLCIKVSLRGAYFTLFCAIHPAINGKLLWVSMDTWQATL